MVPSFVLRVVTGGREPLEIIHWRGGTPPSNTGVSQMLLPVAIAGKKLVSILNFANTSSPHHMLIVNGGLLLSCKVTNMLSDEDTTPRPSEPAVTLTIPVVASKGRPARTLYADHE